MSVCAICVDDVPNADIVREPLGRNGAMVIVCTTCRTESANSKRYAFNGSESARSTLNIPNGHGCTHAGSRKNR